MGLFTCTSPSEQLGSGQRLCVPCTQGHWKQVDQWWDESGLLTHNWAFLMLLLTTASALPHVHCGPFFPLEWLTFSGSQDRRNLLSTAACLGWYGGPERHLFIPFWRPLLPSRWGYFMPKWLLSGNHMGRDGQVSNVTMQIAVSNPNQGLKCQTLNVPPIHVFPAKNLPQK